MCYTLSKVSGYIFTCPSDPKYLNAIPDIILHVQPNSLHALFDKQFKKKMAPVVYNYWKKNPYSLRIWPPVSQRNLDLTRKGLKWLRPHIIFQRKDVREKINKVWINSKSKYVGAPEQMLPGLFESKHRCHTFSGVSICSSVIPYQAFRSGLNVSDPQNSTLTGTIRDASLEKWEVARWISEKRRRNNLGSGPSLFTIPSLEPILRHCPATASSVVRGWSGNTVKCQRGLFLATAGSITNTTACLICLSLSLNRAAVQETISD